VTVNDVMSVAQRAPVPKLLKRNESVSSAMPARLSAQLPKGVTLRLECRPMPLTTSPDVSVSLAQCGNGSANSVGLHMTEKIELVGSMSRCNSLA
jgi:hypothetical protein